MIIHSIDLRHYRGIEHEKVHFAEHGLTVVSGPNESGKSSIVEAMTLVLHERATANNAAVRSILQEGADRPAVVEMDVTIGPDRFTLRKEFGRGRQGSTTLTFADKTRAPLHGDTAHHYVQDFLQRHEDLALFQALKFLQGQGMDTFALGNHQSALQKALDAAATSSGTGDERFAGEEAGEGMSGEELMKRVTAHYHRFFTTKTGRPVKERLTMDSEISAIQSDLDDVTSRMKQTEKLAQELQELQAQREAMQLRHAQVLTSCEIARQSASKYEKLRDDVEAKQRTVTRIDNEFTAAEATVHMDCHHQQAWAKAQQQHAYYQEQLDNLQIVDPAEECALKEAKSAAETQFRVVEARYRAQNAARKSQHAHELLAEFRSVASQITALSTQRDSLHYDPQVHARIDQLDREKAQVDSAMEALAGTVDITITSADHPVYVNGTAVRHQSEHQLSGDLTVDIPGVAEIAFHSAADAAATQRRRLAVEQDLAEAVQSLGVADAAAAQEVGQQWQSLGSQLSEQETLFAQLHRQDDPESLVRQLEQAQEELAACSLGADTLTGEHESVTPDELQAAANKVQTTTRELENLRTRLESQKHLATTLRESLANAEREVAEARLALPDKKDVEEHQIRFDALIAEKQRAVEELAAAQEQLPEVDPHTQLATLTAEEAELRSAVESCDKDIVRQTATLEAHQSYGYHGQWEELRAHLDEVTARRSTWDKQAAAAKVLYSTLTDARAAASSHYQQPYTRTLTALGELVWGDDFAVAVDDDLRIIRAATQPSLPAVDFDHLSVGTQEQLAVLSRLACYSLISEGAVPVVFDDILGYADPVRLDAMASALHSVATQSSSQAQILVFTCDEDRFSDWAARHERLSAPDM